MNENETMQLITEKYKDYLQHIPQNGKHILAQQVEDQIVVYQAFNPRIADFAVAHQFFGGNHYRYTRMSWIKPNFLWMMFRCGWCEKPDQERVLAIWIKQSSFDAILAQAVYSSFQEDRYPSREAWKEELAQKEVRLQWDPDHDPHGEKQERRAIQLGMKGNLLEDFGRRQILHIADISPFVQAQKTLLDAGKIEDLMVPQERIYIPVDKTCHSRIGISLD